MQIIGFILLLAIAIAQFIAAWAGIELHLGPLWAGIAILVAFIFRITLPISIGAFFGATDVWGWHWLPALIFVLPGLLFVIPSVAASIIDRLKP